MLQLESVVQKLAHLMAQQDPAPGAPSPAAEEEEQEPHEWRDWLSLPPEVLHQFLLPCAATEAAEPPRLRAAFASCTALARAALHVSRARLAVNVDRQRHLARGAQVLQRLWSAGAQGASLELHSGGYGTPGRFLAALHSGGVRLDCVSLLVFKVRACSDLLVAAVRPWEGAERVRCRPVTAATFCLQCLCSRPHSDPRAGGSKEAPSCGGPGWDQVYPRCLAVPPPLPRRAFRLTRSYPPARTGRCRSWPSCT